MRFIFFFILTIDNRQRRIVQQIPRQIKKDVSPLPMSYKMGQTYIDKTLF